MNTLVLVNTYLAGFFACAAVHYAIHWWFSRSERVLLVFSILCAMYTAMCLAIVPFFSAKTIPDMQAAHDRFMSLGVLSHVVLLHFYATLGERRDRFFRALVTGMIVFFAVVNLWAPLRGTIVELRTIELPGGGTSVLPIRTPPGVSLALNYVYAFLVYGYGFVVARAIWKRDRRGGALVAVASAATTVSPTLGVLIDFGHVRAPYLGASLHAIFVLCMVLLLSREYSARGARVVATERHRQEAERANRAKTQFLAHVSHEIRNPLHVILGYAQVLERDRALGEGQRKRIGIIRSSGQHLLTLMNDMLEMSKIEARLPQLVEAPFDPYATLDELERMFAAEAASKGIELTLERAPELPRSLLGDGAKVRQILINLASNALKFTKQGSIRVKASSSARADGAMLVSIVVADTGIGIATEDAARIFEPFEQLEAGKRAGGTGLGLAISLAHARLMGGDITVESARNVGSTFTFTFVAKRVGLEAAPAAEEEAGPVTPNGSRRKVLIVDDIAVNRDVLAELLSAPDFETLTAADGQRALSLHDDWHPDVVLIDLRMPGMGGLEAIRRMRAAGSKAAIGALTASALAGDEREALASGADFFMRKPYDDRELLERIACAVVSGPRPS